MADTVQYLLESMLPEFEDFEKRGLFTKQEIKQIVRRRESFEYQLKRRKTLKEDFLRCIEYEKQLEALRKLRKKGIVRKLKAANMRWRTTLGDRAITRRILFVYTRAVSKFKGDLQLWLHFMEFCRSSRSTRQMQKVATRALQLHPTVPGLWMYVAAWEFEQNQNVTAARVLMQRGLRMCAKSQPLWLEYLRMELTFAEKLHIRRKLLGLPPPGQTKEKVEPMGEADSGDGEEEETEGGAGRRAKGDGFVFLNVDEGKAREGQAGARGTAVAYREDRFACEVARATFRRAAAAFPGDAAFQMRFLEVLRSCEVLGIEGVEMEVYASLAESFPEDEACWACRAQQWLVDFERGRGAGADLRDIWDARKRAVEVYGEAIQRVPTVKMYDNYASFLENILRSDTAPPSRPGASEDLAKWRGVAGAGGGHGAGSPVESLTESLLALYKHAQLAGLMTEAMAERQVALLLERGQLAEARAAADATLAGPGAREEVRGSERLWALRLGLEVASGQARERSDKAPQEPGPGLEKLVADAMAAVPLERALPVWTVALEHMGRKGEQRERLLALLERSIRCRGTEASLRNGAGALTCATVKWALHSFSLSTAREIYTRLLALPGPAPDLFRTCIGIEARCLAASGSANGEATARLQKLFESAVSAHGDYDVELWVEYCRHEIKTGHVAAADDIYWRAKKSLDDPGEFMAAYQKLAERT